MPGRGRGAALQKAIAEAKLKEDQNSPRADDSTQILVPVRAESLNEVSKNVENILEIKEKKSVRQFIFDFPLYLKTNFFHRKHRELVVKKLN